MIPENDYLYASSLVRASERGGSAKERLEKILSSQSYEMLCASAAEIFGVDVDDSLEAILEGALMRCVSVITQAVPDPKVYAPLLYKYDCNNIKTAIKCSIVGADPAGMLTSAGTIPADTVIRCAETGDFKAVPLKMGEAARAAKEAYLKTGEARVIDLTVDRACFEDMKAAADEGGVELIIKLVSALADKANILTFLRVQKAAMPPESARALLERGLVCGGCVPTSAFLSDTERLKNNLGNCIFKKAFAEYVNSPLKISDFERILDDTILAFLSDIKFKAFGAEVPLRYLLVTEAEIMNCRIVARSLSEGADLAEKQKRVRSSYV